MSTVFCGKQILETFYFLILLDISKALWTRKSREKETVLPRCQISKYYTNAKGKTISKPVLLITLRMLTNRVLGILGKVLRNDSCQYHS
jgi:hypothetical protein